MNSAEKPQPDFLQTNFNLSRQHQDQLPFSIDSQINTIVSNLQYYLALLIKESPPLVQLEPLKNKLINQLELLNTEYATTEKIQKFIEIYNIQHPFNQQQTIAQYKGFKKIEQFGQAVKKLITLKIDTQNQIQLDNLNKIINCFIKQMQIIIHQDNYTIDRLQKYQTQINNLQKSCQSNDKQVIQLPSDHYWQKQKIIFRIYQPPNVFQYIQPPKHQQYISQVTHVYSQIVPFKIKFISLDFPNQPKINTPNYFNPNLEPQKTLIHYCKPFTKTLITYQFSDIINALTIQKQLAIQKQLPINWTFSPWLKSIITPDGAIFAINCRTTQTKQDLSMFEITPDKVISRGRLPQAKKNSSMIYCNKSIYIIGGNSPNQKCSPRNYKYSIKDKKWKQISNSHIALSKPTICSFRDRYIFKISGLNQFDYINKIIQIYDTTTDLWSIVRTNSKNINQQIPILEDSLAVQISQDQIYIFSGKNANNYQVDTGLIFQVLQIRQKIKAPAKIYGQFSNVSLNKKNVLSFFGTFNQSNVIVHHNCLYTLRSTFSTL